MEFGVHPPPVSSIYGFYKKFHETGYLYKGKVPFGAEYMNGTGTPTCV
jgi:hypothetical protein